MKTAFRSILTVVVASALLCGAARAEEPASRQVTLNINEPELPNALIQFTEQTGLQLIYPAGARPVNLPAPRLSGTFSTREALEKLLKDSGLRYEFISPKTVAILSAKPEAVAPPPAGASIAPAATTESFRLARAGDETAAQQTKPAAAAAESSEGEMVVTGSHIRGVKNNASPLLIFDREAIEKSGFATTHQFIESLPQNFRGGLSEAGGGPAAGISQSGAGTGNNIESTNLNFSNGTNLYGLGNRATLVLLNGQRMAPTNGGSSPDISVIPLTAVERIEILTDGASALYGSDAVGGVINLILRDNYAGNQTRVRYGMVTEGDSAEQQASQAFGRNWSGGGALMSYEYYHRDALDTRDRDFTRTMPTPTYLLPETDTHSVMLNARQKISPRVELFGNGLYSTRRSDSATSNLLGPNLWVNNHHGKAEQYNLTAGGSADIAGSWRADLTAAYGFNDTSRQQVQIRGGGGGTFIFDDQERSDVKSIDLKADGNVFDLGGRGVKAAIGAHYREEGFDNGGSVDHSRSSAALFGEMLVPLSDRVELSLAARHEEYSDFGNTTDPKIGLSWRLAEQRLNLRTTYGTSFRAPLLAELNGSVQGLLFNIPRPGGPTLTAFAIGSNPDLQPETAKTFTMGFDLRPQATPGLNLSMTYFDIRYIDRIEAARALFDVYSDPQFADILDTTPDPAFLTFLSLQPSSFNATASSWTAAAVLADNRFRNTASLNISGVDVTLSYDLPAAASHWNIGLNTTYLVKKDIQISASVAPRDVINTVDNPVDLKLRGSLSWNRGAVSANAFFNYTDGYRDIRFAPVRGVGSWTTLDLNLGYRFASGHGWLRGTELSLNVQNLLDQAPPFVGDLDTSRMGGVHFDVANASGLGRFIVLQASIDW